MAVLPKTRRTSCVFVLLFNKTPAKTSLTTWVKDILHNSISITVLVGCTCPKELPPLGLYYDFINRFWMASRNGYSRHSLLPKGRNSKKPDKTLGNDGKLEDDNTAVTCKDIVSDIMDWRPASDNPESALHMIFTLLAVLPSVRLSLVDMENLTLSDDGTAVISHASPYGRHLSSCSKTCPYQDGCGRHYSDPDAAWGWDIGNKTWFFGHTLYMLCCRNNSLEIELPLLIKFTDAEHHDSKNFLYAIDDFGWHCAGISPKNVCLGFAHDNIPTYELLEHWNINALIDINGTGRSLHAAPLRASHTIAFNIVLLSFDGLPGFPVFSFGNSPLICFHS